MFHHARPAANLPPDVMLQVGDYLDGKSLARMSMTSRGTHDLINGPHAAQHRYAMELSKCGMTDGLSGAPPGALLQRLLHFTDSWMTGGTSMAHLTLSPIHRSTVFVGGHTVPTGNSFIGTSGGYLYQVTRYQHATHLDLWELPTHRKLSPAGPLPHPQKRTYVTQQTIQAVAIDPAQNLLVIMDAEVPETCLWFLDLRTFKPHPEAELCDVMPFGDASSSLVVSQLEICGGTVGVLAAPRTGYATRFPTSTPIRFFYWRTGSLTNILDLPTPWSFCFLNEFQVLIAEYRLGTRGEDSMPILRLCDIRAKTRSNRGQKLLLPWYGPAFRDRQPTSISFVKNMAPGLSGYPQQMPFNHDPNVRLVGIKFEFGPHPGSRPLGYPQSVICILNASVFTAGNCYDYGWFSRCLAIAPTPGTENTLVGTRLVSSQHDPQNNMSLVSIQDLSALVTANHPVAQLYQPNHHNVQDAFRVSPHGRTVVCTEPNTKKIMPTEDHLILLPDASVSQNGALDVAIVNF
ncbi:hypothetical protein ONZ45_g3545 [Pleurotus djamor]|nr:hypothetical protein ONZ45_g3545 [Pleurotus djamor]